MVASRDSCTLSDKPFYGKQKFVCCGGCDIRIHYRCLQFGEADEAALTATSGPIFKRDACAKHSAPAATIRPRPNHRDPCLMKEL
jgi:hypothetical protein